MRFLIENILEERVRLNKDSTNFNYHDFIESSVEKVISLYNEVFGPLPADEELIVAHDRDAHEERSEHAEPEHILNLIILATIFILMTHLRSNDRRTDTDCGEDNRDEFSYLCLRESKV